MGGRPRRLVQTRKRSGIVRGREGGAATGKLFLRFLGGLIFAALIFLGWTASLALVIGRLGGANTPAPAWSWAAALLVTFMLPVFVVAVLRLGFRRLLIPLADLVSAADAVAGGDLSVRVEETGQRQRRAAGSLRSTT